MKTESLGHVDNPTRERKEVSIPGVTLILGGAAVGTYIGFQIGGPHGAAVGALVGSFIGAFAAGLIKKFKVIFKADGEVVIEYETRF